MQVNQIDLLFTKKKGLLHIERLQELKAPKETISTVTEIIKTKINKRTWMGLTFRWWKLLVFLFFLGLFVFGLIFLSQTFGKVFMITGSSMMSIFVILNLIWAKVYENYLHTGFAKELTSKTKNVISVELLDEDHNSDLESSIPNYHRAQGEIIAVRIKSSFSKILKQFPRKRKKRAPKKLQMVGSNIGSTKTIPSVIPTRTSLMSNDQSAFKFSKSKNKTFGSFPTPRKNSTLKDLSGQDSTHKKTNDTGNNTKEKGDSHEKNIDNQKNIGFSSFKNVNEKDPSFLSDDDIGSILHKGLGKDSLGNNYIPNFRTETHHLKRGSCFVLRGILSFNLQNFTIFR